jgi:hypothetical protein
MRRLWLFVSTTTIVIFRYHFSDKRQRADWHWSAEFHGHGHE